MDKKSWKDPDVEEYSRQERASWDERDKYIEQVWETCQKAKETRHEKGDDCC